MNEQIVIIQAHAQVLKQTHIEIASKHNQRQHSIEPINMKTDRTTGKNSSKQTVIQTTQAYNTQSISQIIQ